MSVSTQLGQQGNVDAITVALDRMQAEHLLLKCIYEDHYNTLFSSMPGENLSKL